MSFYALGTSVLIYSNNNAKQIWLADDAAAGGSLKQLKTWWDNLICEGEKFGYFVNQKKSWIILKDPKNVEIAKDLFNSSINVTTGGKRHLGASLRTDEFTTQYMNDKVSSWLIQLQNLNKIAESNPQVAYSAYINGFQHKFTYFMRTIFNISTYLQPIKDFLANTFLPTLFGTTITRRNRDLYSLPTRLGGLGVSVLPEIAEDHYKNSKRITAPLVTIIISQLATPNELLDEDEVREIKREVASNKQEQLREKQSAIDDQLDSDTLRAVTMAREKGASSWLQVLRIKVQGFCLNKGEFRDALLLRYNETINDLPSKCPCGQKFSPDHAMSCKKGGFVHARHDEIRDIQATLLKEICNDVKRATPATYYWRSIHSINKHWRQSKT